MKKRHVPGFASMPTAGTALSPVDEVLFGLDVG
jgi:hypothetical protein